MFLTRMFLDLTSRAARADVADPNRLHKTVMRMFSTGSAADARRQLGILHRLDESSGGRAMLLVQSVPAPDPRELPSGYVLDLSKDPELAFSGNAENPSIRSVIQERAGIRSGDTFFFRLKANTTRKILTKSGADGARSHGKRVPVRGDVERHAWLMRHAAASGFQFGDLRITEVGPRGRIGEVRLAGAVFDGSLKVEDGDRFQAALAEGVGPAKAYGFGLLSIRRG